MRYLASGWRREVNEEYNRNDVRDRDGDIVCVVWDDGDGSYTVQGWDAEWEQCEEDDSHNFATLAEAEREVARRVAESEARHPFPSHTQYGCSDDDSNA